MLESSWRRIVGRAGVATTRQQSISEHLRADAAHPQGSAVYGDILAMFPRRLTVAYVSVIHPGADTFVSAAAATSGAAAKVRDDQKCRRYNRAGSAVYRMVPLSHESYGRMGQPASQLLNELAILASSSGAVGKAQFVRARCGSSLSPSAAATTASSRLMPRSMPA